MSARARVIGWISQGIGKVVPQPDEKYMEEETCEVTEVQDLILSDIIKQTIRNNRNIITFIYAVI